ncbi:MCP four helix bundle domain-containing protein [Marinoscillum pacificum]|uniref:MCP four helix bundle domain-containing protein n=1 Tax=Marinoscillum pacificum TaxID=392723 RepID=UPI0021581E4C|nr:MCP four helix bundle domain-containing protein [Marinoscillum pacificum]
MIQRRTFSKLKSIVALVVVFLLVLATNLMDKQHFEVVERALTTVYEDRLLVKDYLFKISRQLQKKQEALHLAELAEIQQTNNLSNTAIDSLIGKFASTAMVAHEESYFERLKRELAVLEKYESELLVSDNQGVSSEYIRQLDEQHLEVNEILDVLFEIQIKEGKRQIDYSNQAIDRSNLMTKLEIGALIAIGLVIQIILLYRSK